MNTATVLRGDAVTMLRTLPAKSVHCVVTSPLNTYPVDFLAVKIEPFTFLNVLGRIAPSGDFLRLSPTVRHDSRNADFIGVVFYVAQLKNGQRSLLFDSQVRENGLENSDGQIVGCLKAVERSTFRCTGRFSIIIAAESFGNKFDRLFINHANLDSFLVSRVDSTVTHCAGLFDTDIGFSVNQSGNVSKFYFSRHIIYLS